MTTTGRFWGDPRGWFVESIATQTLVLLVIRTLRNPMQSRPSVPLLSSTLAIVAIALLLPYVPFASKLGFVPLPPAYLGFLAVAVVVYLFLVELVKRPLVRSKLMNQGETGPISQRPS